jgi:hypothetical protein
VEGERRERVESMASEVSRLGNTDQQFSVPGLLKGYPSGRKPVRRSHAAIALIFRRHTRTYA